VGAAWFDFDNDGLLDLVVTNYTYWSPKTDIDCRIGNQPVYCDPRQYRSVANRLYRNLGNGKFQDVTNTRKLERGAAIQARLAAVGEMAAGIAHEIRNPLASMSGSIQILRHELPLSSEQEQLMDIVLRESERLNNTIRSFLAYARPQHFQIVRFDVRRALNDAALLLRNSAEVGDLHLIEVDVPSQEVWYEADEGQVKQIVWNLATNGLRAMPEGGRLRLVGALDPAGGGVVLTVKDEGIGIPAEDLDSLFQPFRGRFGHGSGLGLAIVHRIVSDYNGEIQVSSQAGEGTTVCVRLPARAVVAQ